MIQGREEQPRPLGSVIYIERGAHAPTSTVFIRNNRRLELACGYAYIDVKQDDMY